MGKWPIAGAVFLFLVMGISSGVKAVISGDANNDGRVDGVDYTIWLMNYGRTVTNGPASGDFNSNNRVDGLDYVIWLNNYGAVEVTPSHTPTRTPTPRLPTNTPTPIPGNPSGEAMPRTNLPGWQLIFTDDFTTDVALGSFPGAVSSKWHAYPEGWKDTSKNGTYSPGRVVSIRNGVMNMYIHTENGMHLVAAPLPKIQPGTHSYGAGLLYGRYAVRFKADPIPGYKTAWLLWPDSDVWPRDGEIDFPEGELNGTISAFMHRQNATTGSDQNAYSTNKTYSTWHTAIVEWMPTYCRFILDGEIIGTATSRIPNTPMHWVLQTETSLSGTPSNSVAGNVQIDWVAVWKSI